MQADNAHCAKPGASTSEAWEIELSGMSELVEKTVEHRGDRGIVELRETASGQNKDIDCSKVPRAQAEGFAA